MNAGGSRNAGAMIGVLLAQRRWSVGEGREYNREIWALPSFPELGMGIQDKDNIGFC